jgi:hypothetical protein
MVAGLCLNASPFSFASRFQLDLVPAHGIDAGAEIVDRTMRWDSSLPMATQRMVIGREICRWVLSVYEMDATRKAVASLYAFMFPYDEPVSFSPVRRRQLRLIHSQPEPQSGGAYQPEPSDRRPVRGARRL